ncbi:MAG: hypothetical protein Q8K70_12540 [Bacteroidota bacterium]|nr:hypothetical protein [Bacteroidota bacterium]
MLGILCYFYSSQRYEHHIKSKTKDAFDLNSIENMILSIVVFGICLVLR